MSRIRNPNDLFTGVLLIATALIALWLARKLSIGTASSMGPGYLPRLLCFIQIGLGAAIAARGFMIKGDPFEAWLPRPLFWILASIAFFGLTVERFGIAVAIVGLVILSTLGNRATKLFGEAIPLAIVMTVFSILVFVVGLKLPMPVIPPFLVP